MESRVEFGLIKGLVKRSGFVRLGVPIGMLALPGIVVCR
jgi:hypothetical protein